VRCDANWELGYRGLLPWILACVLVLWESVDWDSGIPCSVGGWSQELEQIRAKWESTELIIFQNIYSIFEQKLLLLSH